LSTLAKNLKARSEKYFKAFDHINSLVICIHCFAVTRFKFSVNVKKKKIVQSYKSKLSSTSSIIAFTSDISLRKSFKKEQIMKTMVSN